MTEALAGIIARSIGSEDVLAPVPAAVPAEYLLGMLRTCANELAEPEQCWRSVETLVPRMDETRDDERHR
jgi:hypothetical protein